MRRTSPNQTNSSRYNDENVDIQELLVRNVRRNLVTLVLQYAHNIARSLIIDTSLNWKRCLRLKKYPINSR